MKTNQIVATIILTNGKVERLTIPNTLEAAQSIVGGFIEIVAKIGFDDRFALVIGDEEARCKESPINMPGTLWVGAHGMGQVLHGNLMVVGQKPKEEDFSDCPEAATEQIPKLWHPPSIEVFTVDSYEELMDAFGIKK